jgi:hypothetical protein
VARDDRHICHRRAPVRRALSLLIAAFVLGAAAPAAAQTPGAYYLELTKGLRFRGVTAAATPGLSPFFGLSVVRNNRLVATRYTRRGRLLMLFDPLPGDIYVIHQNGPLALASYRWDGGPSIIGPCARTREIAGFAPGMTAERGGTFSFLPGRYSPRREAGGRIVPRPEGGYAALLPAPLVVGNLVYAVASQSVPNLFVRVSVEAAVTGPCRDVTAPFGRLLSIAAIRLRTLLSRGLLMRVRVDEPGRIVQRLYALRSGGGARGAQRRTTLIGTKRVTARRAGTVRVRIRLTRRGRRAARRARRLQVRTTLADAAGNTRVVPSRTVRLRR